MTKKKVILYDRFCEICGCLINDLILTRKICKKSECYLAKNRLRYKLRRKEKKCKYCGKKYVGSYRAVICSNCKKNGIIRNFKDVEVDVICKKCNKLIRKIKKKKTKQPTNSFIVCEKCKKKTGLKRSIAMKLNNSNYNCKNFKTLKEYKNNKLKKLEEKRIKSIESKKRIVARMKNNNPMRNLLSKSKMMATKRRKIKNGEIKYKRGAEHHLFKGNRNFNKAVRDNLRIWRLEKLKENNFKCEICGRTEGTLNVHHKEPLQNIIDNFIKKNKKNLLEIIVGSEEYIKLIDNIVKYHFKNNEIGIVVCEDCHSKIDKNFKKRKKMKISKESFDGYVYNIEVENLHNYYANSILVSNCHEDSNKDGKHGDLNAKFFDTFRAGTEIAVGGGDSLAHPNLIPFLERMKKQGVICNMTVNQVQLLNKINLINQLIKEKLIYGLGISYTFYNEEVINFAKEYKNSVLHLINGIISLEDLRKIYSKDLKILLLGYKNLRRGEDYYSSNSQIIEENKKSIYDNLKEILSSFKVVSFDNLSIKQLEPKRLLSKEQYDLQYMGDDGQFTMYIDLVKEEFAVSSTKKDRFELKDNIDDMFKEILLTKENNEKN